MRRFFLTMMPFFVFLALLHTNSLLVVGNGQGTNEKLNILLMVPCFPINWSHVNYALSLYMTIRREHNIRFVVLYSEEKALKFLKELSGKDGFKEEIELFDMSKSDKIVDVKQADGTVRSRPFAEGINDMSDFVQLMALFPHMWIDYIERHGYLGSDGGAPPVLPRFDVGIAELFFFNQDAFAVFHALGIPNCIPTLAMSPGAQQLEDLNLLGPLIEGNIPPLEKVEFGDHIRRRTEAALTGEGKKMLRKLYKEASSGNDKDSIGIIFVADRELVINKVPGFEDYDFRKAFRQAPLFFYNTRPQLEFDGGKVLGMEKRVKQIAGVHVRERKELKKGRKLLNKKIGQKIEHIARAAGGFAGIVLISFGTVIPTSDARHMSAVQFEALKAAIVAHPNHLFVWKLSQGDPRIEELMNSSALPNVYSTDWVDQQAILSHPSTKAFVSHCGRNSQFEAAFFGIPLICVPMFADQFYNAESTARQHLGSVLNFFCVEVHGKQYSIMSSKLSGHMELDTEKIKYNTVNELHAEFLKANLDKQVDDKENVLKLLEQASDDCFTPGNINQKLDEAIGMVAQPMQGSLDRQHLANVKQQLRQNPAQELVLHALKEILEKKDADAKTSGDTGGSRSRQRRRRHSRSQRRQHH